MTVRFHYAEYMDESQQQALEQLQQYQALQDTTQVPTPDPMMMTVLGIIYVAVFVFFIVVMWKVYAKAGKPGWTSIIPIYNIYVLMKIINRPGWWVLLYFIPLVNIVISLINAIDLAKVFGKSSVFGVVGLWLFSLVGYTMLAFGKATYTGGSTPPTTPSTPQPSVAPAPTPVAAAPAPAPASTDAPKA